MKRIILLSALIPFMGLLYAEDVNLSKQTKSQLLDRLPTFLEQVFDFEEDDYLTKNRNSLGKAMKAFVTDQAPKWVGLSKNDLSLLANFGSLGVLDKAKAVKAGGKAALGIKQLQKDLKNFMPSFDDLASTVQFIAETGNNLTSISKAGYSAFFDAFKNLALTESAKLNAVGEKIREIYEKIDNGINKLQSNVASLKIGDAKKTVNELTNMDLKEFNQVANVLSKTQAFKQVKEALKEINPSAPKILADSKVANELKAIKTAL